MKAKFVLSLLRLNVCKLTDIENLSFDIIYKTHNLSLYKSVVLIIATKKGSKVLRQALSSNFGILLSIAACF